MDDHDKGLARDLDILGRRRVLLGAARRRWRSSSTTRVPASPRRNWRAVTKPFVRLESWRNRLTGGSWLGLHIALTSSYATAAS